MNEFIKLFNDEQYFESHEVLEKMWLLDQEKTGHLKLLIQIAAMQHHSLKRNLKGFKKLLSLNLKNIEIYKNEVLSEGIDWFNLKENLYKCNYNNHHRFKIVIFCPDI